MSGLFERLRRRLGHGLDAMIARVENHEALVESATHELESAIAHVERERARGAVLVARLRGILEDAHEASALWRERARRENDERRAVECLRRSKRAERRVAELDERLRESQALERHFDARSVILRSRLSEFREQAALLRVRESRNSDDGARPAPAQPASVELGELLERWEARIAKDEGARGALPAFDPLLDDEPLDAAEEAALVLELRALKEK
jgi:phage shock protein A